MVELGTLDWIIIIMFFIVSLGIGVFTSRTSSKSSEDYFLSGRNMPWWLLGLSMVATTFSADTPNLVTDIVRNTGVSGNWTWWAYLLTGMLTVFVYAKLWRRSGLVTDMEFYEMRYSGKPAAFLRGFRSLYLGVLFNVLVMATVFLAGIKLGGTFLGWTPIQTVLITGIVTAIYSMMGGLKGILLTDFFQFGIAMIGTIWAAIYVVGLPEVGGLTNLLAVPEVSSKLDFIPNPNDKELFYTIFLIPIAVQWWASYYPGSEPGGGGYLVQRMLAAKDEKNATAATLLYNILHYAVRPWPWILIALASIIVFPDLDSIRTAFPNMDESFIKDDLAYPAMLTFLPSGLIGLVLASLIAALMSTISTHLNWGASYIVNDFYKRFVKPDCTEKQMVMTGRIATFVLMLLAAFVAIYLTNAKQAFDLIVQVGAGTGLIYILRWFWWRINAYSEITGMIISFAVAMAFLFIPSLESLPGHVKLLSGIGITTASWLLVTFMTRPTDEAVLVKFYNKIHPHPQGWRKLIKENNLTVNEGTKLSSELILMILGSVMVYLFLFGFGFIIYSETTKGIIFVLIAAGILSYILSQWKKII